MVTLLQTAVSKLFELIVLDCSCSVIGLGSVRSNNNQLSLLDVYKEFLSTGVVTLTVECVNISTSVSYLSNFLASLCNCQSIVVEMLCVSSLNKGQSRLLGNNVLNNGLYVVVLLLVIFKTGCLRNVFKVFGFKLSNVLWKNLNSVFFCQTCIVGNTLISNGVNTGILDFCSLDVVDSTYLINEHCAESLLVYFYGVVLNSGQNLVAVRESEVHWIESLCKVSTVVGLYDVTVSECGNFSIPCLLSIDLSLDCTFSSVLLVSIYELEVLAGIVNLPRNFVFTSFLSDNLSEVARRNTVA